MSRSEPAAMPAHSGFTWKVAIAPFVLAGLAACAQTPAQADRLALAGTPSAGSMLEADGVTSKPIAQFRTCATPEYPHEMQSRGAEGTSTLRYLINTEGKVVEAALGESSGHPMLDVAARDAIAKCRFKPAMNDGKPVSAWVTVWYVWSLR